VNATDHFLLVNNKNLFKKAQFMRLFS